VEEVAVSVRELHPTPEAGQLPPPPGGLADLSGPDLPDSAGGLLTMLGLACNGYAGPPAERCPMEGGEAAALARVEYYFWETDMVAEYFNTRNGLLGADFSTKLSAALALGCLSPRRLAAEVRRYEAERTANKSTYWIIFELMTRDYYKFFAMRHGAALFAEFGLEGIPIMWDPNPELLRRWRDGATGMPLVDASMRELAATGARDLPTADCSQLHQVRERTDCVMSCILSTAAGGKPFMNGPRLPQESLAGPHC